MYEFILQFSIRVPFYHSHKCIFVGLATHVSHPLVQATLGGLKRELTKPVIKKEPMTVEMLDMIVPLRHSLTFKADDSLSTGLCRFSKVPGDS